MVAVAGFIPIISTMQGNKSDKERKIIRKKMSFMHTERFITIFKRWVQFCVGAIPRLPLSLSTQIYQSCFVVFYEHQSIKYNIDISSFAEF